MTLKRRHFLTFLGAGISMAACGKLPQSTTNPSPTTPTAQSTGSTVRSSLGFQPVRGPMPLPIEGLTPAEQINNFSTYEVVDDLVLPEEFTYDVIAEWGDRLGNSRFGYNNDFLAFLETSNGEGLLTVNFEYISATPWTQTYEQVIGKSLPFADVHAAIDSVAKDNKDSSGLNAFALAESDPLKSKVKAVSKEALIDQGIGVISVQRKSNGTWMRSYSAVDRRITGISGLEDGNYLKATGPAVAIFKKTTGKGYIDKLGEKIIGTFQNCAGGISPWGTVFSAEENFQNQVPELVYADGTSFNPKERAFVQSDGELNGQGNVFGLAGNKYGWMVELDPNDPLDYGTKHTWLGRYRHEAVAIWAVAEKPLAVYSGCDRRGGHLYKFISKATVADPKDKANSKLLTDGMLYAAHFNENGTGEWIPLAPTTPVNPIKPAFHAGAMINLPKRPEGGAFSATETEEIEVFKKKFKTLGDLYQGNATEKQGAILIDAHYAANAAGATCTARPEDTDIGPDGSLFISFTSGGISKTDGSPDVRIFKGPDGNTAYEYGWIMRLNEDGNAPEAKTFRWEMFATGGEPAAGGLGFANPDNLTFDSKGNLWMVTDMSTDKLNQEVLPGRAESSGKLLSQSALRGLYGNNTIWCLPTSGPEAGQPVLFGIGPMETETTGPCFSPDQTTLFLAVQHPGEVNGVRREMATETRKFAMKTLEGQGFLQERKVPIGSNWPGKKVNDPPKPSVVAIRRQDNSAIISSDS